MPHKAGGAGEPVEPMSLGIDPSLTSTGIVALGAGGEVLRAEALCPPKGCTGVERLDVLYRQLEGVVDRLLGQDRRTPAQLVAAVEGYGYSANGQRLAELGEWGGMVKLALWRRGIRFAVVAPARLKKFVAGKGTAQKDEMRLATYKRWAFEHPVVDVVDAYGLARVALALAGHREGLTAAQAEVVAALERPPTDTARAA